MLTTNRRSPSSTNIGERRDSTRSVPTDTSFHRPSLPSALSDLSRDVHPTHFSPVDVFASTQTAAQHVFPLSHDGASGSSMHVNQFTTPPDLSGLPALANAASTRQLEFPTNAVGTSPLDAATTETLERQPRLASGYEWDERHHSLGNGQDGTACLSVEPDGDGYLGMMQPQRCVKVTS